MPSTRYGNDLRFLKRKNLENTAGVYRSIISDFLKSYGVDCVYYRRGYTFYNEDATKTADPVYGADPTSKYTLKANLCVFMEMLADSYLLNRFGIQSEAEVQAYIGIVDFVERFKPYLGKEISKTYSVKLTGTIASGLVEGILDTPETYGVVSGTIPSSFDVQVATMTGLSFRPLPRPKDSLFLKSQVYDIGKCSASSFSAQLNLNLTTGRITGTAYGSISHQANYAENQSENYDIRPQVGDILVIDNPDGAIRDRYEITRVDRRAQGSNLVYNPLLDAYCYIVTCIQHRDSYEEVSQNAAIPALQDNQDSFLNVPGELAKTNELTTDNAAVLKEGQNIQDFADEQHEYEDNSDDEYGGYGK